MGVFVSASVVKTDVVLVGAGIMSATLGALLRELEPTWSVTLFEKMPFQQAFPASEYILPEGTPRNQMNLFII